MRTNTTTMTRSYSELLQFETFHDRFEYLRLEGHVGFATFGFDRYLNQRFYTSKEWRDVRRHVILRDNACDLGVPGHEIHIRPVIHHMNPLELADFHDDLSWALDPEFLIMTRHNTHNAIHYGVEKLEPAVVTERQPNDTQLW